MFIEGVTVSTGYQDYLCWFLALNRSLFDKLVVVTSDKDWETQNLCRHYHVECIATNIFDGGFNKGTAINLGLDRLSQKGFIIHCDSDIIFPPRSREMLQVASLREDTVYGALRMNCIGFENWIKFLQKPAFIHEKEIYVHLDAFPVSPVISKTHKDLDFEFAPGFLPIGYMQMWHGGMGRLKYTDNINDCSRGDLLFSLKYWPDREKRQLIPEIVLIHLMTEDGTKQGVNWYGRVSQRFTFEEN